MLNNLGNTALAQLKADHRKLATIPAGFQDPGKRPPLSPRGWEFIKLVDDLAAPGTLGEKTTATGLLQLVPGVDGQQVIVENYDTEVSYSAERLLRCKEYGINWIPAGSGGGSCDCCSFLSTPNLLLTDGTESFATWTYEFDEPYIYHTTDQLGIVTLPPGAYELAYTETGAGGGEGWVLDVSSSLIVTRNSDDADVTSSSNPTGSIWVNIFDHADDVEACVDLDATI